MTGLYTTEKVPKRPVCWCPCCGAEIYDELQSLCPSCRKMVEERESLTPRKMQMRTRMVIELDVTTPMLRGLQSFMDRMGYEYAIRREMQSGSQ